MCNLGSAVLQQGYDEGYAKGYAEGYAEEVVEGGNLKIYELVQKGRLEPSEGAEELGITLDELHARMGIMGYEWPEQK